MAMPIFRSICGALLRSRWATPQKCCRDLLWALRSQQVALTTVTGIFASLVEAAKRGEVL
jgi:hypothetical protein